MERAGVRALEGAGEGGPRAAVLAVRATAPRAAPDGYGSKEGGKERKAVTPAGTGRKGRKK